MMLFLNSPLSYLNFLFVHLILKCSSAVTAKSAVIQHTKVAYPHVCPSSSQGSCSIFRDRGEMKKSLRTGQGDSLTIYRITFC